MKRRTRLDQMLDRVKCGEHEVTFDVSALTKKQADRVRAAARARGFDVAGTHRWVLVRDLSCGKR